MRRIVRVDSIARAAAVRVRARVQSVRYLRIRSTHRRAMSTRIIVDGSVSSGIPRAAIRAKNARIARRTRTAKEDTSLLEAVHASRRRNVRRARRDIISRGRKRRIAAMSISGISATITLTETGAGTGEVFRVQDGDHHPDLRLHPRSSLYGKVLASC